MKTIRINGIEKEVPVGAIIFEEFVSDLNKILNSDSQVISTIRVNGREISETDEQQLSSMPLDQIGDIEVETSSPIDLAYETLGTLEQYIDRLMLSIERASVHYKSKNLITGDAYFGKSIDGLDLFVQTLGGIKLALRVGLNPKVALVEAALVSIMNDLLEAKRQNNYLFLAELLEKDLIENLREWKEQIFPMFRTLRSS